MNIRKTIGPVLMILFLVALYSAVFIWLVYAWLGNPYYGHGFLIPLVSGFLVWRKRGDLKRAEPLTLGAIVFALGFVVYVIGFLRGTQFISALSLLIVLLGLILYFYGKKAARSMAFPICFLTFMIPLPFLGELSIRLQSFSVYYSAVIIEMIGIPVTTTGAEVYLPNSVFTIGTPCSGMNTLVSLLALAAILAYILKGHWAKRVALFGLAFPIALFANLFRIVSTLLVANQWGTEAAMGFFHNFSGILFFMVALLWLVFLSWLLRCRLGERPK